MKDPRYTRPQGIFSQLFEEVLVGVFRKVNKRTPWHLLSRWMAVANLLALRIELRRHNLHDTDGDLTNPKSGCPFHPGPGATHKRTEDGTQNDLRNPAMGCRFSRFGRNMRTLRPVSSEPGLLDPNPLLISERLLRRQTFQPATSLNLLAAAWIQFQVHDWLGHENEQLEAGADDLANAGKSIRVACTDTTGLKEMVIPKTRPDPTNEPADPKLLNARFPANRNKNPQWWDGSQVYGETLDEALRLRTDPTTGKLAPNGKLFIGADGFLPVTPATHQTLSGFTDNWWLGLEILHTLFAREHNSICERLAKDEPQLTDQQVFETARLINCAVMAKIHTVEWTPGILSHPAIKPALDANWMGLIGHFSGERAARTVAQWLPDGELKDVLTGVPLSESDHHGAPYALTEEFTAVYRLHPLLPDDLVIRNCATGSVIRSYPLGELTFIKARQPFAAGAKMVDAIYSFGVANPGQITIRNYPDFLRNLQLPADPVTRRVQVLDLAAVDIIRDRERGVPRYNEFRRQLRMKPAQDWLEMAGGRPDVAQQLQDIYKGDLEAVDNLVGMFCEPLPQGFGFSDTAFRIFILMASRRLKSDRFFTQDYTEEFYTKTGLNWIADTGMKEVILRHHPELSTVFALGQNPFSPWQPRS